MISHTYGWRNRFDPTVVDPHAPVGGLGSGFALSGGQFGVIGDEAATAMQGSGAGGAPPGPVQVPWPVRRLSCLVPLAMHSLSVCLELTDMHWF